MNFDVFNGDADGIIALLQLRLNEPRDAQLVTGVKRNIQLLKSLPVEAGDTLAVLDISMEKNREDLVKVLELGATVFYADHHKCGDIPEHNHLDAHIDLDANACTALIVDRLLGGKYHPWAITAAYGDNLIAKADELADRQGYTDEQKAQLKELGTLLNYNGYGAKLEDLHYDPAELYQALLKYTSPFDVIADSQSPYYRLQAAYQADMQAAQSVNAYHDTATLKVYQLPNEAASRRVSGVFGNLLANTNPDSAHAVLTQNADSSFTVSLRAPLNNKQGAGDICSEFATGGGRAAAAGINQLPEQEISEFIAKVEAYYA